MFCVRAVTLWRDCSTPFLVLLLYTSSHHIASPSAGWAYACRPPHLTTRCIRPKQSSWKATHLPRTSLRRSPPMSSKPHGAAANEAPSPFCLRRAFGHLRIQAWRVQSNLTTPAVRYHLAPCAAETPPEPLLVTRWLLVGSACSMQG